MRLLDFSESSRRMLVLLFVGLGLLLFGVGFAIAEKGYVAGFLAGLAANSLAVAFGLWAVDRYADARRRSEWTRVRNWVLSDLMFALYNFGLLARDLLSLRSCDEERLLVLEPGQTDRTPEALDRLAGELEKRIAPLKAASLTPEERGKAEVAIDRYLEAVAPRARDLQLTVMPTLVSAGADPTVIEGCVRLRHITHRIENRVAEERALGLQVVSDATLPALYGDVVELLRLGASLYEVARHRREL